MALRTWRAKSLCSVEAIVVEKGAQNTGRWYDTWIKADVLSFRACYHIPEFGVVCSVQPALKDCMLHAAARIG
jgi:hypothetical protein